MYPDFKQLIPDRQILVIVGVGVDIVGILIWRAIN